MSTYAVCILATCAMSQTPEQDLISELRGSLRGLQESYAQLRVEGTLTEDHHAPKTDQHEAIDASVVINYKYIQSDGRTKITMLPDLERNASKNQHRLSRGYEIVFIKDYDQVYLLRRQMKAEEYVVDYVGRPPAKGQGKFEFYAKALALAPFTIWTMPLSDILGSPAFKVQKVERRVDSSGVVSAKVEFTRNSTGPLYATLTGSFLVEKKPRWRVSNIDMQASFPPPSKDVRRIVQTVEYDGSQEGTRPSKVVFTNENLNTRFVESDRLDVEKIDFTSSSPSEFTLDGYGLGTLSAPPGLASSLPLHWILFAIAGGALLLRILLTFGDRKLSTSPSQ